MELFEVVFVYMVMVSILYIIILVWNLIRIPFRIYDNYIKLLDEKYQNFVKREFDIMNLESIESLTQKENGNVNSSNFGKSEINI